LVLSAVLAALFAAAWFLPRRTGSEAHGRWRPKTPFIPKRLRNVFAVGFCSHQEETTLSARRPPLMWSMFAACLQKAPADEKSAALPPSVPAFS